MPSILTDHFNRTVQRGFARLPEPAADAQQIGNALQASIRAEIARGDFMSFARFMALALYMPGLGYYSAGAHKLGVDGDFVTAPEISPLFAVAIANQLGELIDQGMDAVLELGAGSGKLAADTLLALSTIDRLPRRYLILEVSAQLRARQHATINERVPQFADRVEWLDALPGAFTGIVLANEVFDALPVELIHQTEGGILQRGVGYDRLTERYGWIERDAVGELRTQAHALDLPAHFITEIHLESQGLLRSLCDMLTLGVILILDYGFCRREYYLPERREGTLMCHYRHHAHADPFFLIGLQDITSHVDFSALARVAVAAGLQLSGYCNQANFLINCGILDALAQLDPSDAKSYAPACAAAQKLLGPGEMGELFKVIAFGKGIENPLLGFRRGDRRLTL